MTRKATNRRKKSLQRKNARRKQKRTRRVSFVRLETQEEFERAVVFGRSLYGW